MNKFIISHNFPAVSAIVLAGVGVVQTRTAMRMIRRGKERRKEDGGGESGRERGGMMPKEDGKREENRGDRERERDWRRERLEGGGREEEEEDGRPDSATLVSGGQTLFSGVGKGVGWRGVGKEYN